MKITYIHQYFNTPAMPGSTRSYEMASRLVRTGHDVKVITSNRERANGRRKKYYTRENGINVCWIPVQYSNHMKYSQRVFSFIRFAISSFIEAVTTEADLVFASSTPLTVAIPGIWASKIRRIPFIFEVRDLWPRVPIAIGALSNVFLKWLALKLEKWAYSNSDAIIALSPGMKEGIIETNFPADKIYVIPNGSDLIPFSEKKPNKAELRRKYNISEKSIVILYPGTFGVINNLNYLVELASHFIGDNRVQFVAVGDGVQYDNVVALSRDLGCLGNNFNIYKQVSKENVVDFFALSDAVISTVLPLKEMEANSANKIFDGMASGCCLVVNHGGWLADLFNKYECGFELSKNVEEAAVTLEGLLNTPERFAESGDRALKLAKTQFDRDKLADELCSVFVKFQKKEYLKNTLVLKS